MSADRHEEEYHLTPDGWFRGSQRANRNKTKTVARPAEAVLTLIKESISPCGIDPAEVSWLDRWRSKATTEKEIMRLLKKHGDPRVHGEKLNFRPSSLG
jgi:hypothetical protein